VLEQVALPVERGLLGAVQRRGAGFAAAARGGSISPNRNESRPQMGRAPIAKMSRMIPPTPVAAP